MRGVALVFVSMLAFCLLIAAAPLSAGDLHRAITGGDVARVREILRQDPAQAGLPDEADQFQSLPLHLAAIAGNVEIARLLLDAGADINCGDSDESTPLDCAALNRRADMVGFLVSRGADINRRDKNGAYALSFAASGGDSAIVHNLIRAGSDLNFQSRDGYRLMHFACLRNLRSLFDLLVARGHDIGVAASDGTTPLHLAATRGNAAMVEVLLSRGAPHSPANDRGETPLLLAALRNRPEVGRLLLAAGAGPDSTGAAVMTPMHAAVRASAREFVQVLIDHGADVGYQPGDGQVALLLSVDQGDPDIVDILLKAGARVDVRDQRYGRTPLHVAALRGYPRIAGALLDHGAEVNVEDANRNTALDLAVKYGNRSVADLLVARGGTGGGGDAAAGTLAAQGKLAEGEAVVWYLNHAGWAVKTREHLLVFDYFNRGADPAEPGLCNGHILPSEIAGQRVAVFATHEHPDHLDTCIYRWHDEAPSISYVFGCQPEGAPPYQYMGPREERVIDGVKVTTIDSNDPGVGFWVEVDGLVIFHAGDHANRWRDFSGPYKEEIDFLAAKGVRPDLV